MVRIRLERVVRRPLPRNSPHRAAKRAVARYDENAPGDRNRDTGALNNVGNNGYSWASTVSGTNGMNLNFNVTWLNPSNANNRAYGFQLRCLSAFTRTSRPFL